MTKTFAQEAASRNIRYNTITPGFIATDMTDKLSEEIKTSFVDKVPLKRFGTPKDIADAAAFLLSDYAGYITGETLKVNGGIYM
jgi:3-oxoacyl-[acyl-carrier protein] reductase